MRRIGFLCVLAPCLAGLLTIGCSGSSPPPVPAAPQEQNNANASAGDSGGRPVQVLVDAPTATTASDGLVKNLDFLPDKPPEAGAQEKYDAALLSGLNLMMDHRYTDALAALQSAQALQDTGQIRQEIERLKGRIDQQTAAQQTVRDIQTVLDAGRTEEASGLAARALEQYGATDAADQLTSLKRQADALAASQMENSTRRSRFRQEGDAALQAKNLRAAAIAYEQALQNGDDPDLRRQLEEVHGTLTRYDDNRRRAAELRQDPANLEDALAALQEADRAWDTGEVRQEIDLCTLALQKRRDRLGVADFEVRGDVGMPYAGRSIAEELLPAFKVRYDLVERAQLGKIIDELKIDGSDLVSNQNGHQEVARLARMRYVVVGSVSCLGGITVSARLVDVSTGLVVQTARMVASSPQELLARLPQLANCLMMTDEQKQAYVQQLVAQAAAPAVVPVIEAPLPPPPVVLAAWQPPPAPVIAYSVRPPEFGSIRPEDFLGLAAPGRPVAAEIVVERDEPVKHRLLQVAVNLGDNLFLRGRFHEANAQFELALNLAPDREEIRVRVDRCRPHLPPPVVVPASQPTEVLDPTPAPPVVIVPVARPARPRIAILNFLVNAEPSVAPPCFGDWAAEQLASYFTPNYEVVDRGVLFWYMGRLGLSVRDVLTNDGARRWLGRALNVRFFVFGVVEQTGSFTVTTHLVDSESNTRQGGGKIHVQDQQELKLRMGELASQTPSSSSDNTRAQQEAQESEKQINTARRLLQDGRFKEAIDTCQEGLKRRPQNVALQTLLQQAQQRAHDTALAEARKHDLEQHQAEARLAQQRQQELARQAEAARIRAAREAAVRSDADRRNQKMQRRQAHDGLVAQAQKIAQQGNYHQAAQMLASAVALQPDDEGGKRALADVRAREAAAERTREAEQQARRKADELDRQNEALAQSRAKVNEEQRRRNAEEQARRKAQEERDQATYAKRLEEGRRLLNQHKPAEALAALQGARAIHQTDEVDRLSSQAGAQQALAAAQQKGTQAQVEMAHRLAEQEAARKQAEAQARHNHELYNQAVQLAQKAMAEKHYDQALAHYDEAGKLFSTDEVLTGKRQAEQARAREHAVVVTPAVVPRQQETSDVPRLIQQGRAALAAKQLDKASAAFGEAAKLAPGNADAQLGLAAVLRERSHTLPDTHPKNEEVDRQARFQKLLDTGRGQLAAHNAESAIATLRQAVAVNPQSAEAQAALHEAEVSLQQAEKVRSATQAAREADMRRQQAEQQQAEFARLMARGKAAMTANHFEEAVKAFGDAEKLRPTDATAIQSLNEARRAMQTPRTKTPAVIPVLPTTPRPLAPVPPVPRAGVAPAPPDHPADYGRQIQVAQNFEKKQQYADAAQAYREALRLKPSDARASAGLRSAELARHLAEGRKNLESRHFPEAASEFEEVLKIAPGHPEATAGLRKAREGRP